MAVNLSPVGGVAAQFFDNSGNVLTGGLLYSYLAGTTTPATTYTQSNGLTAHPNPIVLNAAGRVPDSGEIWLSDGVLYKFALKDQYGVQIATYDNIDGINSNFIAYTSQSEVQTATQGQTVFTLVDIQYTPATNNLAVYVNGSKQIDPTNSLILALQGKLYLVRDNDPKNARKYLEQAILQNPNDEKIHFELGMVHFHTKDYELGRKAFEDKAFKEIIRHYIDENYE
jgi:tetratricopeptide (TPR) repeat protein